MQGEWESLGEYELRARPIPEGDDALVQNQVERSSAVRENENTSTNSHSTRERDDDVDAKGNEDSAEESPMRKKGRKRPRNDDVDAEGNEVEALCAPASPI